MSDYCEALNGNGRGFFLREGVRGSHSFPSNRVAALDSQRQNTILRNLDSVSSIRRWTSWL